MNVIIGTKWVNFLIGGSCYEFIAIYMLSSISVTAAIPVLSWDSGSWNAAEVPGGSSEPSPY